MSGLDLSLYLVTDGEGMDEAEFLRRVEAALRGGVTLLQLREKQLDGRCLFERAAKLNRLARQYGVPLLIDDRVDVALAVDAAGVHVGQRDLPVSTARRLLGPGKIVGATAKTVEQALDAHRQGADYLGVGAIYPTTTKVNTVRTSVETLTAIRKAVPIPIVAIGGLSAQNLGVLRGSGASGVAVVSAIMRQADPEAAARALRIAAEQCLSSSSSCSIMTVSPPDDAWQQGGRGSGTVRGRVGCDAGPVVIR